MARIVLAVVVVALAAVVVLDATPQGPAMAPAAMAPPPPSSSAGAGTMPANLPCVAELAPCADFYQDTSLKTAESCCAPLRKAYGGELGCLCSVLTNPALVAAVGIDMKKGISLFGRCGIKVPADVCSSHVPAMAPASSSPTSSPKSGSSAVPRDARWMVYSGVLSLFLI